MALGTYDQNTRRRKQQVPVPGPQEDGNEAQALKTADMPGAAAPAQVAPAPQLKTDVTGVSLPPASASTDIPPASVPRQVQQSQGTGTNQESQVGPAPTAGAENPGGVWQTRTNYAGEVETSAPDIRPPFNAPLKTFDGMEFSTVTPEGRALTDSDMDAYYDMLRRKSQESGVPIQDLDRAAAGLLVGKAAQQGGQAEPLMRQVTKLGEQSDNAVAGAGAPANSETPKINAMPPVGPTASTASKDATAASSTPPPAASASVPGEQQYYDGWKDFTVEQLKDMLPANGGNPAKKAALERLIREKGGSVPAAQASPDAPRYTQRQQSRRDAAARKMGDKSLYNGNVDLLNRPSVDAKTMQAAGYTDIPDGSHASVYSMQNGFNDKSRGGKVREILYTPIMADGTVLSQKEVDDYITGLGKKGDIVELDKPENGGRGLVIAADVTGDPGPELHRLQEDYYSTPEDYAARDKAAREDITSAYGGGNLDPLHVKSVKRADMEKAGWNGPFDGDEVSVYPLEQTIIDSAGNRHTVLISPITRDGEIMTQQEFEDYVEGLQGSEDIMADDKSDKAVIIKYDATKGEADALHEKLRDVSPAEEDAAPPSSTFEVERTNDVHQSLSDDLDRATEAVDRQSELIRQFAGDPTSGRGALALKLYQDKLKEEGYDEESEKRLEKRRRTAGIIANIGDVLQGFANLAGTWFGADSQKLTSLSAAARAGEEKVDAKRKERKDELRKSYEKAITKIGDDMQAELKRLERVMERANDRLRNYEVATGKEAQRASNREKQREQDYENTRKRMTLQQKYKEKNARQAQEFKKEMEQIKKENKIATIAFSAEKQKEVKRTPGARSKSGKKKGGGKGSSGPASRK